MGTRGPAPGRPRVTITVSDPLHDPEMVAEWDGLDPEICSEFDIIAMEMGMDPGRLLEQQMRSFLARRNAPRNRP
jgi:hypothetical protein